MAAVMRALVVLLIAATPVPPARAAEEAAMAVNRIKAAFLYKFAAYVEWPAGAFRDAESPVVIGIAGAEPILAELTQAISGRKVGARSMQVHRLERAEGGADCCQILFIGGGSERARAAELLAQAQGRPVLTVTESEAGHPQGSVINFVVEDRVRFDIARGVAERNGLQVRSQLLGVARQVSP